jgi:low temperature requirement protein LtrA
MAVLFMLWWWYFDGAAAASEQVVRSRRDAIRLTAWSYAHLPLYLGVIVLGVGLRRSVSAAARTPLPADEAVILGTAAALVMVSLILVAVTAGRQRHAAGVDWKAHGLLALVTLVASPIGGVRSPEALSVSLAALMLAQLALSLRATGPPVEAGAMRGLPQEEKESMT